MNLDLPEQERHEMVLECTNEDGEDEWYCPTCGRRVLISYPPDYKKTVLHAGDMYALHSAGKGGVMMGASRISEADDESEPDKDESAPRVPGISTNPQADPGLAFWEEHLDNMGFEGMWGED